MRYKISSIRLESGLVVKQINKRKAKRLFLEGKEIFLMPCNMNVTNPWMKPCPIQHTDSSFDAMLNNYTYYNCMQEMGNYPHFFTSVDNI